MFTDNDRMIEPTKLPAVPREFQEIAVDDSWVPLGPTLVTESHVRVQSLAYLLWQERGSPIGSPDEDWFNAVRTLNPPGTEARLPLFAFGLERLTS